MRTRALRVGWALLWTSLPKFWPLCWDQHQPESEPGVRGQIYTGFKVDSGRSGGPGGSNPTTPTPHGPGTGGPARPFQFQAMGLVRAVLDLMELQLSDATPWNRCLSFPGSSLACSLCPFRLAECVWPEARQTIASLGDSLHHRLTWGAEDVIAGHPL